MKRKIPGSKKKFLRSYRSSPTDSRPAAGTAKTVSISAAFCILWDILRLLRDMGYDMAILTAEDLEKIEERFMRALADHPCRFPITNEQATRLANVVNVFEELGSGSLSQGINVVRQNHIAMVDRQREIEEIEANHVFVAELRREWPEHLAGIKYACEIKSSVAQTKRIAWYTAVTIVVTVILAALGMQVRKG